MAKVVAFNAARQTTFDLEVQRKIADDIEWCWQGIKIEEIGDILNSIDWKMSRDGKVWCVAEFKALKQPFKSYRVYPDKTVATVPNEILYDIDKYDAGWRWCRELGCNISLGVRAFYDRVSWCDLRDVNPNHNRYIRNVRQPDRTYRKCDTFSIPLDKWTAIFHHKADVWLGHDKEAREWTDKPGTDAKPGGTNNAEPEVSRPEDGAEAS